ncbi:hypothetical protein ACH4SP_01890 [Streptomyces sp. NPDC021093]|uniref:hypothetical protein n=1 Tax=Streptomyces sp. NPDC021093 TaxID=3365112 RepID=UPI00379AC0E5
MERWDRIGRGASYGAALALLPYLLIKVTWVIGALVGVLPTGMGLGVAEWAVLNTVTIGMAAIGIGTALALVRPWGMRIPGPLVGFCAWVASGFLVSILPFALFSPFLGGGDEREKVDGPVEEGVTMPAWEAVLIQCGFVGMGLCLAVAIPAYLRRRWPDALPDGRLGDGPRTARPWAAVVAALVGLVWLYWAFGGTVGLSDPSVGGAEGRLLAGVSGFWALAAAAALWGLARARPARLGRRAVLLVGWVGSGSLFAWSSWKLPLVLYETLAAGSDVAPPGDPLAAVVLHLCAVVAGAAMLLTLVRGAPVRGVTTEAGRDEAVNLPPQVSN